MTRILDIIHQPMSRLAASGCRASGAFAEQTANDATVRRATYTAGLNNIAVTGVPR
jgi:hypothetical protein